MSQTENFRRHPPTPLAPRSLGLPTPHQSTLTNGLQILIIEDARLPLVTFRLAFRTGDADDPPDLPGLSDMTAAMLTEGTKSRTSRQIADEVARLGGSLAAGSAADYTTIAAAALKSYSDAILGLMADIVLHPSFLEEELDLIKQNTVQGLVAQRAQPAFLASERISRAIYGGHPYAIIAPTPQSIEAMTRDKLASFHRSTFVPNNAVLIVVGDVRRDHVIKRAEELFGGWQPAQIERAKSPALPEQATRHVYLVDRPGSAQSNIVIGNLALTRTDPDYFSAIVMNTVLGATPSARIFMNLRESKGYTYGAYSNLDMRRRAGSFRATAEVRAAVTGDALREFFYEFDRIRREPVTDKELRDAKSYLTGIFPIRLETQEGLIDQLVQIQMFDLPQDYLHTYRDRINDTTKEDVQQVANEQVAPERAAIVVVGDAAAVMDQVKPFAERVEVYDSSGNRHQQAG